MVDNMGHSSPVPATTGLPSSPVPASTGLPSSQPPRPTTPIAMTIMIDSEDDWLDYYLGLPIEVPPPFQASVTAGKGKLPEQVPAGSGALAAVAKGEGPEEVAPGVGASEVEGFASAAKGKGPEEVRNQGFDYLIIDLINSLIWYLII